MLCSAPLVAVSQNLVSAFVYPQPPVTPPFDVL